MTPGKPILDTWRFEDSAVQVDVIYTEIRDIPTSDQETIDLAAAARLAELEAQNQAEK